MIGVVTVVLPTLDQSWTPKHVDRAVRASAQSLEKPLFQYGLVQGDLVFYLNSPPAVPRMKSELELQALINQHQELLLVTDKRTFETLTHNANLSLHKLDQYLQPNNKHFYLLSLGAQTNTTQPRIDG